MVPLVLVNVGVVTRPDALMLNTDDVEVYTLNGIVEVLKAVEKLMVNAEVEALVMLALVMLEVPIVSVVFQKLVAVRLVEEAETIVPFEAVRVVRVA
jgi:hypothetical protein